MSGRNGSTSNIQCYGAEIKNCYNVGNIVSDGTSIGNIVGYNKEQGILNNCYYLENQIPAQGINNSTENNTVYEKSAYELRQENFETLLNNGSNSYRFDKDNKNNGYPILVWVVEIKMEEYPYKLTYDKNAENLDLTGGKIRVKNNYSDYDFILDLSNENIEITGFENNTLGIKTLNVVYKGEASTTYDIEIVDKPLVLTTSYSTKEMTKGTVTVTINSNKKIQQVEGWTLSKDGTKLSKEYAKNTEDIIAVYEAKANISINNIDTISPQAEIKYSTTKLTNKNVTVAITADEKIKEVEGWSLSDDKTVLTKEFETNQEENITIYDLVGNERSLKINVSNIDKISPELEIKYSTIEETNGSVTVEIKSNEKVRKVEGWILNKEQNILTKEFNSNIADEMRVYDLAGNITIQELNINNTNSAKELPIVPAILPKTGGNFIMIFIGMFTTILTAIVMYKKIKNYKDIK